MYILFENFKNVKRKTHFATYFRQRFMVIACKGEWVHCEIIFNEMGNQIAYAGNETGMVMMEWKELENPQYHELYPLPSQNWQAAYEYCQSQVGKVYDKAGVVGMMYGVPTYNDDAVFCSELCENVVNKFTGLTLEQRPPSLVSPLMLRRSIINQGIQPVPISVLK